MYFLTLEFSPV